MILPHNAYIGTSLTKGGRAVRPNGAKYAGPQNYKTSLSCKDCYDLMMFMARYMVIQDLMKELPMIDTSIACHFRKFRQDLDPPAGH